MTFSGRIRDGRVVLDGNPELPEGAYVTIHIIPAQPKEVDLERLPPLGKMLMQFAGKAVGLPPDASTNHDHYLYGTPKR